MYFRTSAAASCLYDVVSLSYNNFFLTAASNVALYTWLDSNTVKIDIVTRINMQELCKWFCVHCIHCEIDFVLFN